jgi:hypothetical protein
MIDIEFAFPHLYEVEDVPELPGSGKSSVPWLYFPRPVARPEHDGIYLKVVTPIGESWVGVFGFGYSSPPAISRVISTPNPQRICVISSGTAYFVTSNNPEEWETIDLMPITGVRSIAEHRLLVFADFSRLVAHDGNRVVWESPRLCWDDLQITEVDDEKIKGVGHDPTSADESHFAVDLKTGRSLLPSPLSVDGKPVW